MSRFTIPILISAAWVLSSCDSPAPETPTPTPGMDLGAPALWSVETFGADGAVARTAHVCTDGATRAAFSRSLPVLEDGTPCVILGQPSIGVGRFSARCQAGGVEFTVHNDAQGDLASDFTVETVMTADTQPERVYEQTSRFRHIGACPSGWAIGDSGAPGDQQVVNIYSGATRAETVAP